MFASTLTYRNLNSNNPKDVCYFTNPSNSTYIARNIFFTVSCEKSVNSLWEIYINPTVTDNGTSQSVTNWNNHDNSTNNILLYRGPTISDPGTLIRKFVLPGNLKEFSTNGPWAEMLPGESVLIRRIQGDTGTIISTWTWSELQ